MTDDAATIREPVCLTCGKIHVERPVKRATGMGKTWADPVDGHHLKRESWEAVAARLSAALDRLEAERDEAKTRWNRSENHAAGMQTQLTLMARRAEAAEAKRDAAFKRGDEYMTAFHRESKERMAAEAERDRLREALRGLIPWAGRQTFENDEAWVTARAALSDPRNQDDNPHPDKLEEGTP